MRRSKAFLWILLGLFVVRWVMRAYVERVLTPMQTGGIFFILAAWIRVHSTELAITNRRVIAKFGFIKRDTVEINLEKVEALRVEQGFWGRILNFGTILMTGTGGSIEPIPNIADPLVFRRKFMEATDRPITMPRT
jgi:uncharacterized membrane protein YdbT with pleckstrin-like domain